MNDVIKFVSVKDVFGISHWTQLNISHYFLSSIFRVQVLTGNGLIPFQFTNVVVNTHLHSFDLNCNLMLTIDIQHSVVQFDLLC